MATIWRVKDGPSSDTTDQGTVMSLPDISRKLHNYVCEYLSPKPPRFNSGKPSEYYRHVVIEVTNDDELNTKFPSIGFYVVANLDSAKSSFLTEPEN